MAAEPSSSNTTQAQLYVIKFPPFPDPPEGVTILPFKDFKPNGIQLFAHAGDDDDVELDGLGIPTVELRVKHETDDPKSNSRKRRKKKKSSAVAAQPGKKLLWYEEWDEGEHLRVAKSVYDREIPRVDRFFQAATDFKSGRKWPHVTYGLNNLWDQFRLYVGLVSNQPKFRKADKYLQEASPDLGGDFSEDDKEPAAQSNAGNADAASSAEQLSQSKKRRRPGADIAEDFDDDDEDDEEDTPRLKEDAEEEQEEKLSAFLDDPEMSMKIFLSSYMREQGLIWSEKNLANMPRLLDFFINFILRNRVLPELKHERGLRKALEIIEIAKTELPLTFKIGQILPDPFSEACKECWGRKGGITWQSSDVFTSVTNDGNTQAAPEISVDMDVASDPGNGGSNTAAGGWSNATTGWASADADASSGWGTSGADSWGEDTGDVTTIPAPQLTEPSWTAPTIHTLDGLLGPTTLPLTHTTGIVEYSTRRIKALHPIPATSPSPVTTVATDAETAEDELDRRFAKVVLAPWIVSAADEGGDITNPMIKSSSRGPVIMPGDEVADGAASGRKPHDPYKDDIVLLVEPSVLETLHLGMGLGALWIQIARQEDLEAEAPEKNSTGGERSRAGRKKKGKKGAGELKGNYWYIEDLSGIFPSFFTSSGKRD
ncbi:hypothetical protein BV22DRAFT_1121726 [Leucogyrophana mollusca]|uniref:Uncharacterized protein n=1 Tax=Leucogyrophana mollusca TaxID=85980 RepID=A0ACB8B9D0_9AGAM|nr:hypothetical protein BV22DRAFT_1121726 [Leucogyrophana mollusca]